MSQTEYNHEQHEWRRRCPLGHTCLKDMGGASVYCHTCNVRWNRAVDWKGEYDGDKGPTAFDGVRIANSVDVLRKVGVSRGIFHLTEREGQPRCAEGGEFVQVERSNLGGSWRVCMDCIGLKAGGTDGASPAQRLRAGESPEEVLGGGGR